MNHKYLTDNHVVELDFISASFSHIGLLTRGRLFFCNIPLVSSIGPFCCIPCRMSEEDLDYILWSCDFSISVWNAFFELFGLQLARLGALGR